MKRQIQSSIQPANELKLYKIFGEVEFSFQAAYAESVVDWSAFYTQLDPQHSMRYLPKKWGDGADFGCLVELSPINQSLKLLKVQDQTLANPKISGEEKALLLKQHLHIEGKLMEELGKRNILLQCVDAEDQQIIISHSLLKANNFSYRNLISFKKSEDGLLRTVGYRKTSSFLEDGLWKQIKGDGQFQPYLLFRDRQIDEFLNED